MICTCYSNSIDFDSISEIIKSHLPKAKLSYSTENEFRLINVEVKKGFFSSSDRFKISYRQRLEPNSSLDNTNCALSNNIKGLHGFVGNINANDAKSKDLFLLKIHRVNCEFSIIQEKGNLQEMEQIVKEIATNFDAFLFVQPDSLISKSAFGQHFLNKDLNLILDHMGQSEVKDYGPEVEALYLEKEKQYQNYLSQIPQEQRERKLKNEKLISSETIKVNKFLPAINSEAETTLRTPGEVAERVTILAIINLFTSDHINAEQTVKILKDSNLLQHITPKEKDLIDNPTDEKKSNETWKCEGIWVLLWALNINPELGNTTTLCDLGNIPSDDYPIHNPKAFLSRSFEMRSKTEIINKADLYYRYDWACVNLRIRGFQSDQLNQGLVYERHYALNWLINHMGQDWDNVSCDT